MSLKLFQIDNEENEWDENEEGRDEEELEEEEMRRQNGTESEENEEVEEEKEEENEDDDEGEESEDNLTLVKRHHHNDLTKHSCNAQNGHSDLDSGISSVTNGSSSADHTEKGLSRMLPTDAASVSISPSVSATASSSGCSEDAQSIDSYVTCGDDQTSIATTAAANLNMTASDYSLHYSDADESLTPPSASTMSSSSYLASSHSQHDVSPNAAAATNTNGTFTRSKSFIPFKQVLQFYLLFLKDIFISVVK
jgi:hypothetical protein